MQKKARSLKKLNLHRETLRRLAESALWHAVGGTGLCPPGTDGCPVGESLDTPCAPSTPQLTMCGPTCA
jgi:hypothetical protein